MAGARVPLTFRLYKGDAFLREESFTQAVVKVGKAPSSHLRLDDESVGRMHAVIEVIGPNEVNIIDLGAARGIVVNGQKINKSTLQTGDTVLLGDIRVEVAIGVAAEDDAPTNVQIQAVAPDTASGRAAAAPPPPSSGAVVAPPGMRPPVAAPPVFAASQAFNPMADQIEDTGGARAVEVAAMLGDSIVSIKHCMNPRGGKVTAATYAMFGIGAASLVTSLVAFSLAKSNAAYNHEKLEQWTKPKAEGGQGRPAYSFRPDNLGVGYDIASFGGLALGVTLLTMGLARFRNERVSPFYRVGRGPGLEYVSNDIQAEDFPLVAPSGDDFVFNFSRGMDGEMTVDGQSTPLAELAAQGRARPASGASDALEVSLPAKARIRVKAGKTTFLVSSVPAPRRQPVPLFAGMESNVMAYFGGSAAVFFGLFALIRTVPADSDTGQGDDDASELALATGATESQEDPPPEEPEEVEDDGEEESGGTGTAMTLEEGKMGKKDSDRAEGQYKMKNNNTDPQIARAQALEAAKSAGILGSAALTQGAAFASLTGTGDISSGFDDADIYGGLLGNEAGEMQGGFGFGRSGFGPGGGGTGWGTIGTGRYGTIGHGSGTGSGYGVGGGRGGMRGRQASVPQVRIGQPSAVGDLDKAIIRRYIKRNLAKISYCYEKELLAKPGLQGTVATQFFISPNGTVASANASGVDNNVASCVAGVLKAIEFPKPKGGGGVQVNYPFNFRPSGG